MNFRQNPTASILVFILMMMRLNAQNPSCPSNLAYLHTNTAITVFDPGLPPSSTNPASISILPPTGSGGLALLPNINGGTLTPTFYTVINSIYHYWTGSTWQSTGHTTGSTGAVNIGGCGSTIYNSAGPPPITIYTYNGTANGTSLCIVPTGCVADVVVDCDCSFYLFQPLMPNQALLKYSPGGVLQSTTAISGIPNASGGGGFAIIGNTVYYTGSNQFYAGTLGGAVINFTPVPTAPGNFVGGQDWACCPSGLKVNITASADSICSGRSVTLTASGASTYSWIPSGTGSTLVVSPVQGPNVFTVNAGSSVNCGAQAQIPVFGLPSPTVQASISQPTVCAGQTVHVSASGAQSYSWQPVGSGQNFTTIATSSGIFTVTGMANTGSCTSQGTVQLQVDPGLSVSVSGKTLVCKGDAVTYTASGAATYSWNGTAGSVTYNFIAAASGSLLVKGSNPQTSCEGSTTFKYTVKICTGIGEEAGEHVLVIYPNPAKETIRFNSVENFRCRVFDMKGAELDQISIDANGGADISHLPSGVYFIRLEYPFYSHVKLVKE